MIIKMHYLYFAPYISIYNATEIEKNHMVQTPPPSAKTSLQTSAENS